MKYLAALLFLSSMIPLFAHNKNFVIVITSYNNKKWFKRNLDSVFTQDYPHYRVLYIDDCSPDKTGAHVMRYIQKCKQTKRCSVIINHERRRALANHYRAIITCEPDEIIVQLDGDDWFADKHVLTRLNEWYQDDTIWLVHAQYTKRPANTLGDAQPTPAEVRRSNCYRHHAKWLWTGMRSFYAWLAHSIDIEDLMHNGDFFPVCYDYALMFPMLEMSGGKFGFIAEPQYIYNVNTPLNDFRVNRGLQENTGRIIRQQKKYPPTQRTQQHTLCVALEHLTYASCQELYEQLSALSCSHVSYGTHNKTLNPEQLSNALTLLERTHATALYMLHAVPTHARSITENIYAWQKNKKAELPPPLVSIYPRAYACTLAQTTLPNQWHTMLPEKKVALLSTEL